MNFDAQFNGYHRSVLDDLLPYDNKDQQHSYWTSQVIQQCKGFLRYHGYVYSFTPIYGLNNAHSEYPRGTPAKYEITCKEEMENAPIKFQENPLVKKIWAQDRVFTRYFKFMAKPKAIIKKYSDYSINIMKNNSIYFV